MKAVYLVVSIVLFHLLISLGVLAGQACAEDMATLLKRTYNPDLAYPGNYKSNGLYFRNSVKSNWLHGTYLNFPEGILCREALLYLNRTGLWKGNFKFDGSCGSTGEPTDWAVGNRLNYESVIHPDR